MAMSAELGLDAESAATFRSTCAEKFNLLLSQIGIQQDQHTAAALHDQPMQAIQRSYFLALGAVSECSPLSPRSLAATVQRYLRLFWNRTTFELFLNLNDTDRGHLFRSVSGSDLMEENTFRASVSTRSDWLRIPLIGSAREYGFLSLPRKAEENGEGASLPMFMRVLGMQIESQSQRGETLRSGGAGFEPPFTLAHDALLESLLRALPFQVYLLDASGAVVWADAPHRQLLGANIFAISRPAGQYQNSWNAAFLSALTGVVRLKASLAGAAGPRIHDVIFAPVRGSQSAAYLLLMAPNPAFE